MTIKPINESNDKTHSQARKGKVKYFVFLFGCHIKSLKGTTILVSTSDVGEIDFVPYIKRAEK